MQESNDKDQQRDPSNTIISSGPTPEESLPKNSPTNPTLDRLGIPKRVAFFAAIAIVGLVVIATIGVLLLNLVVAGRNDNPQVASDGTAVSHSSATTPLKDSHDKTGATDHVANEFRTQELLVGSPNEVTAIIELTDDTPSYYIDDDEGKFRYTTAVVMSKGYWQCTSGTGPAGGQGVAVLNSVVARISWIPTDPKERKYMTPEIDKELLASRQIIKTLGVVDGYQFVVTVPKPNPATNCSTLEAVQAKKFLKFVKGIRKDS